MIDRRRFIKESVMAAAGLAFAGNTTWENSEQSEQAKIKELVDNGLEAMRSENYLRSPYLVSCFYYSENYFSNLKYKQSQNRLEPNETILLSLYEKITPEDREKYQKYILNGWAILSEDMDCSTEKSRILDLDYNYGTGENLSHQDAVDIYAPIGTELKSPVSGVVVLADKGWDKNDQLSTVSKFGGNSVIIFDPTTEKQYRLSHLQTVDIKVGDIVSSGSAIGKVGQTGTNADKLGPDLAHVHVEINQPTDGRAGMQSLHRNEIKEILSEAS